PDEILIAVPSASGEFRRAVVTTTRELGVPVKTLPGLHELISGEIDLAAQIRPVQVEDVLGREPVDVDLDSAAPYVEGKTVLVTGAGGSTGSELCRQLTRLGPQRVILVELTEKAVNPKGVMGQTKAVCESVVDASGGRDDIVTRFAAVRFSNVLGSSGSVITIFRRQIEKGGTLTVTHPEMTRFFMTIPEAAS